MVVHVAARYYVLSYRVERGLFLVLFFRVLTRVFIMGFAYFVACLAAVMTLVVSIIGWRANFGGLDGTSPEEELLGLLLSSVFGVVSFLQILASAFIPAVVGGLITEGFSWRSIFVHVAAGGVIGLYIFSESGLYPDGPLPQQEVIISLASGFVAGFFYWLIAGRRAGSWHTQKKDPPPSILNDSE